MYRARRRRLSAEAVQSDDLARGPETRALGFSRFMTEHLKEQYQLYRALMRGRAGPIIIDQIRQFLCEIVRRELATTSHKTSGRQPAPEFAVQFVVGAYMSIVTWWLDRGAKEKPEEIDDAFRELALAGLSTHGSTVDLRFDPLWTFSTLQMKVGFGQIFSLANSKAAPGSEP
jgi:hypothetical protein